MVIDKKNLVAKNSQFRKVNIFWNGKYSKQDSGRVIYLQMHSNSVIPYFLLFIYPQYPNPLLVVYSNPETEKIILW